MFKGELNLTLQLAQGIVDNSYLLEGREIKLNETGVRMERVMGNNVLLETLEKSPAIAPGESVKIFLEKKTVAIRDFDVIMGGTKEASTYLQEDMPSALVNSGQFNVVERQKLQCILEELKLSQMGLIDSSSAKQVGKMLGADLLLTGTLAFVGEKCNANIRIIDSETGLITAAFNKKGPLVLKAGAFKEIKNIKGSFEDEGSDMEGWLLGRKRGAETGRGGYQNVSIDKTQGANGTGRSLAMDFKLGSEKSEGVKLLIQAGIRNHLKRVVGQYQGIRLFIKASKEMTVFFIRQDRQKDSKFLESWLYPIPVYKEWRKVPIPFSALSVMKKIADRFGTDQILDLRNIKRLSWIFDEAHVDPGTGGVLWLDEVTFY